MLSVIGASTRCLGPGRIKRIQRQKKHFPMASELRSGDRQKTHGGLNAVLEGRSMELYGNLNQARGNTMVLSISGPVLIISSWS